MDRAVFILAGLVLCLCLVAVTGFVAYTVDTCIEARRDQERKEEVEQFRQTLEKGIEKIPDFRLRRLTQQQQPPQQGQPHEVNVSYPFGRTRVIGR